MATTDLKLDEPGTLSRPGPIGRPVRLGLGILCLWYVYRLIMIGSDIISPTSNVRTMIWNGILPGLFLVSYVVNIGHSRAWRKWPAIISAIAFALIAVVGHLASGTVETVTLARLIWVWELYVFGHLGLSFLLAAIIGTPGCEMRAFHDLYSRATGMPTKEHCCPVGPLHPIDQWEAGGNATSQASDPTQSQAVPMPTLGSAVFSNTMQRLTVGINESELPESCRERQSDCVRFVRLSAARL